MRVYGPKKQANDITHKYKYKYKYTYAQFFINIDNDDDGYKTHSNSYAIATTNSFSKEELAFFLVCLYV